MSIPNVSAGPRHFRSMSTDLEVAKRLKRVRTDAGYDTAGAAARAIGIPEERYRHHENGIRGLSRDGSDERYARFYRVSLEWLRTGRGPMRRSQTPVLGFVGAGAEVFPVDDHAKGAALDHIDTGLPEDAVALVIRGESQYPLQDGWVVIYRRADQEGVPDACLNRLCIAKVKDGPTLLKTLRRGPLPRTFNLESWNAAPREGVKLDWASPVLSIRPR